MSKKHKKYTYTVRRRFTCPRCGKFVEAEVDEAGRTVCPACENTVVVA